MLQPIFQFPCLPLRSPLPPPSHHIVILLLLRSIAPHSFYYFTLTLLLRTAFSIYNLPCFDFELNTSMSQSLQLLHIGAVLFAYPQRLSPSGVGGRGIRGVRRCVKPLSPPHSTFIPIHHNSLSRLLQNLIAMLLSCSSHFLTPPLLLILPPPRLLIS